MSVVNSREFEVTCVEEPRDTLRGYVNSAGILELDASDVICLKAEDVEQLIGYLNTYLAGDTFKLEGGV